MPLIKFGFRVAADGSRLPFTVIKVGRRTLEFCGRPGAKLTEAVEHLEEQERAEAASAAQLRRCFPAPSDPRD